MNKYQIHNRDCLEVLKEIENESIDMILTDPPFGNNIVYGRSQLGYRTIQNDNNLDWLPQWSKEAFRVLKDDSHCVVFWQWRTYSELEQIMLKAGFTIKTVAVWDKNNAGLGDGLAEQYEQIVVFKKGNARQNKFRGNVFRYSRVAGRPTHPHEKPVQLLGDLMLLCSNENDIVLDCFSGTFNTGVTAIRYGRRYVGCEIEEKYFKIGEEKLKLETSQSSLF